jgi:hypothetical protein
MNGIIATAKTGSLFKNIRRLIEWKDRVRGISEQSR